MGRKEEIFELDGSTYKTIQYPGREGTKIFSMLGKIIGPSLGALMGSGVTSTLNGKVNSDAMEKAFSLLFSNIPENQADQFFDKILSCTKVIKDGTATEINFDLEFTGRIGHLIKLAIRIVRFNFDNVFQDLVGMLPKVASPMSTQASE